MYNWKFKTQKDKLSLLKYLNLNVEDAKISSSEEF